MGKAQKKTGKGRLDKYYKLAKEQGYRARSAFKLIQLNKKYSFLESSRCCIDLCAAPGGWLQVASKYMPVNSVIIGVDLVPIKPIPRVVTFTSDITTLQCRNLIRSEIKDWKADVVLHDGAPNVGTAWVQDAFSQSELVLMSLKLAVEFLMKGGTFVTKVFRSADYNNLIWVFNQLFGKVEATKPPSSRNVSAEIFVVCRDFLAPKHIDPKFLDSKHVFKELTASASADKGSSANNFTANVFQPDKKRRKRDGYEDGDYTLFRKAHAADFIRNPDPISVLGSVNKIVFETEEEKEWLNMHMTTPDVLSNCEDLKVLGKGDFKNLIKWRTALREELGLDVKTKHTEELTETIEITEDVDDEQQIQDELERLNAEAAARAKRDRRRANENKTRTIQRMQLQMTAPLDIGLDLQDQTLHNGQDDIFDLIDTEKQLHRKGGVERLMADPEDIADDSDVNNNTTEENEDDSGVDFEEGQDRKVAQLEAELDGLYDSYQERLKERDTKYRVKEARRKDKEREEWHGIQPKDSDDEESDEGGGWEELAKAKAQVDQDSDSDEETEDEVVMQRKRRRVEGSEILRQQKKVRLEGTTSNTELQTSRAAQLWFDQDLFDEVKALPSEDDDDDMEGSQIHDIDMDQDGQDEVESMDQDVEVVPQDSDDENAWDVEDEDIDATKQRKIQNHGLLTEEAVSLAQQLVNRQKTRTEMINDGFNRYSLNSKEGLPDWFLDDEGKHYKTNIPITKEAVAALRAKQRALDARPIKKVAEAKARKKYKAVQRLEKATRKAEGINDASDLSEKAKAQQIEKLMRRGTSGGKKTKKEIKVVVAKGAHKGVKGRPKGVKGRYQMVDSRMKKEMRAAKRREKKAKKSR